MRKGIWSAATAIVLLSGAGLVLWGPAVRAADSTVAMKDELAFEPADVTVPVGGSVVWHNDGGVQHDAKADDGSFSTPMVDPGKNSQPITFRTPGDFKYFCTVPGHKAAGMVGTIHVGAASTPTTGATTTTTQAPGGGPTTTAAAGQSTTTTTKAAAGASTTTTTAAGAGGATTTTVPQAQSVTPTSAPDGGSTSTTIQGGGEAAEGGHGSGGGSHDDSKSSPIGIAFAAVSTLLLGGIAGKLLMHKP